MNGNGDITSGPHFSRGSKILEAVSNSIKTFGCLETSGSVALLELENLAAGVLLAAGARLISANTGELQLVGFLNVICARL